MKKNGEVSLNVRFMGLQKIKGLTSSYEEWGLESTNLSIGSKPHRCLNLLIVADFPSTTKVS